MYDEEYYRRYQIDDGVYVDYENDELIQAVLSLVAARLRAKFRPGTHLDVGCATGHLVRSMLSRGVESYGVDVSEYAVAVACRSGPGMSHRCWVQDVSASPLYGWYDLVTCIEVAEHIDPDDIDDFLDHITSVTSLVFFSSTSEDDRETHVNMQPQSYWIDMFARRGFVVDEDNPCEDIIPHSMVFRRSTV